MSNQDKQKLILQKASDLFANKGFTEVTMDEIATSAGIAKGTIYNYFRNKNDLIASLMENNIKSFLEILEDKPAADQNFHEFLLELYEKFLEKAVEIKRPFVHSSLRNLPSKLKEEFRERILRHIDDALQKMGELFKIGIERGELKPYPPEGLANFFLGIIFLASHDPETYIKRKKEFLSIFFYGIMKEEEE